MVGTRIETLRRLEISTTYTLINGSLQGQYFTAPYSLLVTSVSLRVGAATTGQTLARIGLYTTDPTNASGNGTLVASTPNDPTLFTSANSMLTKNFSSQYQVVRGQRYIIAFLVVGATSLGSILVPDTLSTMTGTIAPVIAGSISAQTDLPATIPAGFPVGQTFWAALQ